MQEALTHLTHAARLRPSDPDIAANVVICAAYLAEWDTLATFRRAAEGATLAAVGRGVKAGLSPFYATLLYLPPDEVKLIARVHSQFAADSVRADDVSNVDDEGGGMIF
jgi:hypothetical protein